MLATTAARNKTPTITDRHHKIASPLFEFRSFRIRFDQFVKHFALQMGAGANRSYLDTCGERNVPDVF